MHCQLSRLPVAYTVALVDKAGAVLFVVASWALPCTLHIMVLYPSNSVHYGACIHGVGGLCVVGGARHGRVWVTDAARLYQPSPDTISAPSSQPHGLTRCQPAVSTSKIYGANSPPIRSRIFSRRRGLCSKPLIW